MTDAIMISKAIRTNIYQTVETEESIGQDRGRPRYEQNYRRGNFRSSVRSFYRQISRGEYRNNYRNEGYDRSRNRSRERSFSRSYGSNRHRRSCNSRSRSGLRDSTNRDRISCYNCRERDHFAKDCPTSREEKEIEQLQQMLNLEDEQTSLKSLVTNTQDTFGRANSEEKFKTGTFKLIKGRNDPTTFLPLSPKIGGQITNNTPNTSQYLTKEQARHVYKRQNQAI